MVDFDLEEECLVRLDDIAEGMKCIVAPADLEQ
jgi:hypothetical protein